MGRMDNASGIATIRSAIDSGITLIDTAQSYNASQEIVGRALKGGYRNRCFLATKASFDFSRKGIVSALEESLEALSVEHIDLYQIHRWDPEYPVEESMETLKKLRDQGKIRTIGVSNYNFEQMRQALRIAAVQSNQLRYSLFDRQIEAAEVPFCEQHGIGILAHSPLSKGLLTGKYSRNHTFPAGDERSKFPRFNGKAFAGFLDIASKLNDIAQARGVSLVQLAIAWILRLPALTSVLIGAKNQDQLEEALQSTEIKLGEDELKSIDGILSKAPRTDSFGPFSTESFAT